MTLATTTDHFFDNPITTTEERIKVRIQMLNGNEIKGFIYLEGTNFERRVSTLLNDNRQFIPMTEAEIFQGGKKLSSSPFTCINKQAIAMVYEENGSI